MNFPRSLLAVALISAVGLAYEVLLTNLYAVTMQYHYVFLALSVAMFGAGVGALAVQRLRPRGEALDWALPAGLAALLTVTLPALLWLAEVGWTVVLILVSALPFVLVGGFLALVLQRFADRAPLLYGADLLGAALGAALSPLALNGLGGPGAGMLVAAVAGLAALQTGVRRLWSWAAAVLTVAALGLQLSTGWVGAALNMAQVRNAPPDKTMVHVLKQPGARIRSTTWDAFARVDVVETDDPTRRMLFLDGGAGSYMYRWDGNPESVASLRETTEFLPFALGPADRTLVIGPGGGRDVLLALLAGAREVDAVELAPGVVRAVEAEAAYNGGLTRYPGVTWTVADGRNFLRSSGKQYDLIVLDLVYTQVAGARSYALSENYIFTQEAFQDYYDHLAPGGRVAVIAHQALEGSRAFLTGLAAWQQAGGSTVREAGAQGALLMADTADPMTRTTVAVWQKGALSNEQKQLMGVASQLLSLRPLFVPGLYEEPFQPLLSGRQSLAEFTAEGDYNLAPATDNQPFFFNLEWGVPPALTDVALLVVVLALLFALWAAWPQRKEGAPAPPRGGGTARLYLYAGVVGLSYMLIQLPLIQRFLLALGNPVTSTATVLVALLVGGGLAGMLAQRSEPLRTRWAPGAVALLSAAYIWLIPALTPTFLRLGLSGRVGLVAALCLPLGFVLGLPFPRALARAHQQGARLPVVYAVNSVASILGSVLAMILAVSAGFTVTALVAVAGYALAAGLLPDTAQPERKSRHA